MKAPEVIFQDKQKEKTSVILDNFVAYLHMYPQIMCISDNYNKYLDCVIVELHFYMLVQCSTIKNLSFNYFNPMS